MAELADAADSKSAGLRPLGVQLPLPAPFLLDQLFTSHHLGSLARSAHLQHACCIPHRGLWQTDESAFGDTPRTRFERRTTRASIRRSGRCLWLQSGQVPRLILSRASGSVHRVRTHASHLALGWHAFSRPPLETETGCPRNAAICCQPSSMSGGSGFLREAWRRYHAHSRCEAANYCWPASPECFSQYRSGQPMFGGKQPAIFK
jgi:hypothetical protein